MEDGCDHLQCNSLKIKVLHGNKTRIRVQCTMFALQRDDCKEEKPAHGHKHFYFPFLSLFVFFSCFLSFFVLLSPFSVFSFSAFRSGSLDFDITVLLRVENGFIKWNIVPFFQIWKLLASFNMCPYSVVCLWLGPP